MRNLIPTDTPEGVSTKTTNVNSVLYSNYINGGPPSAGYGLAELTAQQQQNLQYSQNKLNKASVQISKSNRQLKETNNKVMSQLFKNMNGIQESLQTMTGGDGLNNYTNELIETKNKIKQLQHNNIDRLVEDSDIIVLQQNYNYLLWSILATGCIIISMNIK
jgi:hypothetical protein